MIYFGLVSSCSRLWNERHRVAMDTPVAIREDGVNGYAMCSIPYGLFKFHGKDD